MFCLICVPSFSPRIFIIVSANDKDWNFANFTVNWVNLLSLNTEEIEQFWVSGILDDHEGLQIDIFLGKKQSLLINFEMGLIWHNVKWFHMTRMFKLVFGGGFSWSYLCLRPKFWRLLRPIPVSYSKLVSSLLLHIDLGTKMPWW